MSDIEKYKYCQDKIQQGTLEERDIQWICDDYMNIFVEYYVSKRREEMRQKLSVAHRFRNMFAKTIKDYLSYYIGIFSGMTKSFEILSKAASRQEYFHNTMTALYAKSKVKEILEYLYAHPESQHKMIVESMDISKSYLTQLLRELEREGCVERFATGKRSFYSLSVGGQAFVRKKRAEREFVKPNFFDEKYTVTRRNQFIETKSSNVFYYNRKEEKLKNVGRREVVCNAGR